MYGKLRIQVYFLVFLSIVFWGLSFVWSKQALQYYNPISVIFFRLILSIVFLFLFGYLFNLLDKVEKQDWKKFILIAFWEPFAYFLGENYGLTLVTSTTASVIIATIPLFSPIAAYYFHYESITKLNFVGIVLSVFGVFLVVLKPDFTFKGNLLGYLFLFWAVFSAVMYSVFVLDLSKKYNVFTIITYQNSFGLLMFLPLFLLFDLQSVIQTGFIWQPWKQIFLLAIFASSLAFIFFTYGIKHLGITKTNILTNFIPIITSFFSFLILNERFTWFNIIGILIVILGVVMAQIGRTYSVANEF